MPCKDGTGPLGQGSGMGKAQRNAARNQLQQCGTGWGRKQSPESLSTPVRQGGMGRRFNLTNQDESIRPPVASGRRAHCRYRLMSSNPNA